MTAMKIINGRPESGGYKVDVSCGGQNGRVSSEWFSRPYDEKYLSLSELYASVKRRAEQSKTRTVESAAIRVEAHHDDPEKLALVLPDADAPVAPTHRSFGQLASLVGAPAAYMRQLPAPLAGINLQYGLTNHRAEQVKTMEVANGCRELRAVTGPDYGRIYDHELVSAVQRIAGDGVGDKRWKVPGVLDWSTGIYNPMVDVTKDTTTLYASDRDVFLFLVDEMNPIEAGTLPDGSPDLFFRGFYCWNPEVGAKTLGIASFYLRAVCQNRNLLGVEDFQEISIRHSKYAANRFAHEAAPALASFANSSPQPFIARRTLLVSLTVRPLLDDDGSETGMFEIPAGGRRYRALELLVKQRRLNKTAPVPCIVRTEGLAEEDSPAGNVQRAPLHPLDQFRAFQAMREKGRSEEEIAAAFFVSASVVKQRLKLAAVSASLLDAYAEEEMTLDHLMAFTVNPDHERQEQVWEALKQHYNKQPYEIRRMLTEGAVCASDRRAQFVGLDNYVEAGGEVLRDLFQTDDGGRLQDADLLETMVSEKLN